MLVFAGELDAVTPAGQVALLQQAPGTADVRVVAGADHFSFMDTRPPGTADPAGSNREARLAEMARAAGEFCLLA
ncbi:MAG TPA: hypothetical protein VH478_00305 [Trebonia sp.]|nr:hypothetical protein [Trebonia sp.]